MALLFVAGIAGAAAMIVPGFSGSFVLVAMGVYWTLIDAVHSLDIVTLLPAIAGGMLGIVVVSKGLDRLLHAYPSQFYYCILGLIIASIYELYPGVPSSDMSLLGCVLAAVTGFIISSLLSA
jgi:putative membrane protein